MIICGKEYEIPEIDYNAVCELDKYGLNLLTGTMPSPFVMIRAFLALALKNKIAAGQMLQEHIIENGVDSLAEAFAEISKAMEESGFLQKMRLKAEAEAKAEAGRKKAAKALPKAE